MRRDAELVPAPVHAGLALDEALLESIRAGGRPILRFWVSERAVVIGRSQDAADEVDRVAAERDNVPVVRRCSGGGAVVHYPGNLNVSLVIRAGGAGGVEAAFARFGACVSEAIGALGVGAYVEGSAVVASSGKLSGAAQARRGDAVLYHCTLLLEPDVVPMDRYLRALRPGYVASRVPSRPRRTVTVSEIVERRVEAPEAVASLGRAFAGLLGGEDGGQGLTPGERARGEALRRGRYEDPSWTW